MTTPLRALMVSLLLMVSSSFQALAHTASSSSMLLDIGQSSLTMETRLPVDQLVIADPTLFRDPSQPELGVVPARLNAYLADHLILSDETHPRFLMSLSPPSVVQQDGVTYINTTLAFSTADGTPIGPFRLHSNAILHRVLSHKTYVSLRSDLYNGRMTQETAPLDVLKYKHETLNLQRNSGSHWQAFYTMLKLGAGHIAAGTDHLMFLLCLLLPAPLLARAGQWQKPARLTESLGSVFKIVSAFTFGHSLTLALGILGWVKVPSQPVEILVALSVMISALHAVKPIFARFTLMIAMGFGLIHGLAFASEMLGLGLSLDAAVIATLGFNLGIEAVQLLIVVAVLPCLMTLARTPLYRVFRLGCAVFAAIAAAGWVAQRAWQISNFVDGWLEWSTEHGLVVYLALVSVSLVSHWAYASALRPGRFREPKPRT